MGADIPPLLGCTGVSAGWMYPKFQVTDHGSPRRKRERYGMGQAEEWSGCPSLCPETRLDHSLTPIHTLSAFNSDFTHAIFPMCLLL